MNKNFFSGAKLGSEIT